MTQQFDPTPETQDKPKVELPLSWHEDNVKRFGAETFTTSAPPRCKHDYYRPNPNEFRCRKCTAGWVDNGRIPLPPSAT